MDGSVVLILLRFIGPYKLAWPIWLSLESIRREKNVSMIHISIHKLMDGNSTLIVALIISRKFM